MRRRTNVAVWAMAVVAALLAVAVPAGAGQGVYYTPGVNDELYESYTYQGLASNRFTIAGMWADADGDRGGAITPYLSQFYMVHNAFANWWCYRACSERNGTYLNIGRHYGEVWTHDVPDPYHNYVSYVVLGLVADSHEDGTMTTTHPAGFIGPVTEEKAYEQGEPTLYHLDHPTYCRAAIAEPGWSHQCLDAANFVDYFHAPLFTMGGSVLSTDIDLFAGGEGDFRWGWDGITNAHRDPQWPTIDISSGRSSVATIASWTALQRSLPCSSIEACARPSVVVDGHVLSADAIGDAMLLTMARRQAAGATGAFDPSDPAVLREALARAAFTAEVQRAARSVYDDPVVVDATTRIVDEQRAAFASATPEAKAKLDALANGRRVLDPSSPEAAASYRRTMAFRAWVTQHLRTPDRSIDQGRARAWFAERAVADGIVPVGVTLPIGTTLADHLALAGV
jgi:hypothetical protein